MGLIDAGDVQTMHVCDLPLLGFGKCGDHNGPYVWGATKKPIGLGAKWQCTKCQLIWEAKPHVQWKDHWEWVRMTDGVVATVVEDPGPPDFGEKRKRWWHK